MHALQESDLDESKTEMKLFTGHCSAPSPQTVSASEQRAKSQTEHE